MSWRLRRGFRFEAAHHLPRAGEGHPCQRVHGHSYRVVVEVRGDLDPGTGWVVDFDDIDRAIGPVRAELDHRLLNDVSGLENPTAELIAKWVYERMLPGLPGITAVTIWETEDAEATYQPRHD